MGCRGACCGWVVGVYVVGGYELQVGVYVVSGWMWIIIRSVCCGWVGDLRDVGG